MLYLDTRVGAGWCWCGGVMLEVVTDSFYAGHAAGNHHVIIARFTNIIKHKYNQRSSPQLRSEQGRDLAKYLKLQGAGRKRAGGAAAVTSARLRQFES